MNWGHLWLNPVGQTVRIWGRKRQIIDITRDFHFESLYEELKAALANPVQALKSE